MTNDWLKRFQRSFSSDLWSTDRDDLLEHSHDAWPVSIKAVQDKKVVYCPEILVRPRDRHEVADILRWTSEERVPVTPWGAGSGVVGGALATRGGVCLDLSRLNRIIRINPTALYVTAEAGVMGDRLEAELNSQGFTLHHSPQSLDRSTVGGWVATRACGQFSSRWGAIEDLVLAVTAALPNGEIVETNLAPRAAIGPDLKQLFLGSEGTLGVVLEVSLKISPISETQVLDTLVFDSLHDGLEAVRLLMRTGIRPFLVRLYDLEESKQLQQGAGFDVGRDKNVLLLGSEGPKEIALTEHMFAQRVLEGAGGRSIGRGIADSWMNRRFDFSAVENQLAEPGGYAETIEIAGFWDRIEEIYLRMRRQLLPFVQTLFGHFSHAYPQGISLYLILFGEARDPREATDRLREIWKVAMENALDLGAAMSHHHGVGIARSGYVRRQLGSSFRLLEQIRHTLDPTSTFNPGKLGDGEDNGF